MSYIIDGYNLLFWIKPEVNPLEHGRKRIAEELSQLLDLYAFKAIIVFDSCKENGHDFPSRSFLGKLEIIFSPRNQSADDYIVEFLTTSKLKSQMTLVSSDRDLCQAVKALGVHSLDIETFVQRIAKKQRPKFTKPDRDPHIEEWRKIFEERFRKSIQED